MWILTHLLAWIVLNIAVIGSVVVLHLLHRYVVLKYGRRIEARANRAVLITGATSGLGLSAAKHLHRLGFSVFAGYFSDQEAGYKELSAIGASSESDNKLFLVEINVTCRESISKAHARVEELCSRYNLSLCTLVNNAGTARAGPFEWTSEESISEGLETNLKGLMLVTRQFISKIVQNKGRVVNVSSGLNQIPLGGASVYGSTKSGIAYFSEALHQDLRVYGSSCHAIMPGNLIVNSNIIYSRVQSFQESQKRLSVEEKVTFQKSIESYSFTLDKILRVKLRAESDPQQVAKIYGFELPEGFSVSKSKPVQSKKEASKTKRRTLARLLRYLSLIDGRLRRLDNSAAMEAFEQAVCVRNPPRRIYAGNAIYNYLTGPQMEFLPPLVGSLIGRLVSYSWEKELRSYKRK